MGSPIPEALLETYLQTILKPVQNGDPETEVIVRSSSHLEDTNKKRMAGVFESVGPLKSEEEAIDVLRHVFASAFSSRATEFCQEIDGLSRWMFLFKDMSLRELIQALPFL